AIADDARFGQSGPSTSLGDHRHARGDDIDCLGGEQTERGQHAECPAHLPEGFGSCPSEFAITARLEVDDRYWVACIGKHDGKAARHTAGPKTGDRAAPAHHTPSCSKRFRPAPSRWPRPRPASVRPLRLKSSPQMAEPMVRNADVSGVATPASSPAEARNERPRATSSRM